MGTKKIKVGRVSQVIEATVKFDAEEGRALRYNLRARYGDHRISKLVELAVREAAANQAADELDAAVRAIGREPNDPAAAEWGVRK